MVLGLGNIAPNFEAQTTKGFITFHSWLGDGWGLFFSHPEDYTPVCTTELGVVAQLKDEFAKRNIKAIALSVDNLESHNGWIKDIEQSMDVAVGFPIIADETARIAQLYGMIHNECSEKHTIRSVFIIGPDKEIKLHLTYPMAVGRNFDEILRVIDALQLNEQYKVLTPANWKQDQDVLMDPALTEEKADNLFPSRTTKGASYMRFVKNPKKN